MAAHEWSIARRCQVRCAAPLENFQPNVPILLRVSAPTLALRRGTCHSRTHDNRKGGHRHPRVSAAATPFAVRAGTASSSIHQMASVPTLRDTWLALGVSTLPSDRPTAEAAVADLYRHAGFRCPEFVWVPSPPAGAELVVSEQLSGTNSLTSGAAARIASTVSRSRERMDNRTGGVSRRWPSDSRSLWAARTQPLAESARQGIAPDELLRIAVWDSLRTSLFDGVAAAVRSLVQRPTGSVAWYGQQEAHRLAYYDIHRTLGISAFRGTDHASSILRQPSRGRPAGGGHSTMSASCPSDLEFFRPNLFRERCTTNGDCTDRTSPPSSSPTDDPFMSITGPSFPSG